MVDTWQRAWAEFVPFLDFPIELRTIVYTTNAIESSLLVSQRSCERIRQQRVRRAVSSALAAAVISAVAPTPSTLATPRCAST